MADMSDVRRAVWEAYKREERTEEGIMGKSAEGACELLYPTYWECETLDEFLTPSGIMIYSYAIGPSRGHHIWRGEKDQQIDSRTWESPDIYAKAVEVVRGWMADEDDLFYSEEEMDFIDNGR